jgi:hypothetical protein
VVVGGCCHCWSLLVAGSNKGEYDRAKDDATNMVGDDYDEVYDTWSLSSNTLTMLQRNDPMFCVELLSLELRANRWIEGAGSVIGDNISLYEIQIIASSGSDRRGDDKWLVELCEGLSKNRTIKSLRLTMTDMSPSLDIFQMLTPFIEHNRDLANIQIVGYDTFEMLNTLPSALSKWKNHNEKDLTFNRAKLRDDHAAELVDVLQTVPNLVDLRFHDSPFKRFGSAALSNLIRNPSSQIHALALGSGRVDDGIVSALMTNEKLEYFNLTSGSILSASGWRTLSMVLSQPSCAIIKLVLGDSNVSDRVISSLGNVLAFNTTLEHLFLGPTNSITAAGWQEFSTYLRNPNAALIELHVSNCNIDPVGALWIASSLRENTTLRTLTMGSNPMIGTMTSTQWQEFVKFLTCPHCAIEELNLYSCGIDDEGMVTIATALSANFSLMKLNVRHNDQETSAAVIAFIQLLVDCNRTLTEVESNVSEPEMIIDEEWEVLRRALCDTTSIETTYWSNHTCYHCGFLNRAADDMIEGSVQEEIRRLLILNYDEDKAKVARRKIVKYHFSRGNTGIHALSCMHEIVLPHAIAWIGRDEDGYSSMFNFVRCFPALFDHSHALHAGIGSKKRKI